MILRHELTPRLRVKYILTKKKCDGCSSCICGSKIKTFHWPATNDKTVKMTRFQKWVEILHIQLFAQKSNLVLQKCQSRSLLYSETTKTCDDNSFADQKFWQFLDSFSNLPREIFSCNLKDGISESSDLHSLEFSTTSQIERHSN